MTPTCPAGGRRSGERPVQTPGTSENSESTRPPRSGPPASESRDRPLVTDGGETASETDGGAAVDSDSDSDSDFGIEGLPETDRVREMVVETRAIDSASIPLCLTDPTRPDNPVVYVNRGFEEVTGYDAEECLGRNCRFLQGEDTDPAAVAELRDAVREERATSVEVRNYRKDGTPFWNEVYVVPIYDDEGDLVYFLGSQRDITERKEREEQLRVQREQLEALNQLNRVIRGINSALVSASTREEIEQVVCERLAAAASYDAAWIGKADSAAEEITLRASAGLDEAFLDAETTTAREGDWTPAIAAAQAQEVRVVRDVERGREGAWRDRTLDRGFRGAVAIPIGFQEFQYDVLVVYTTRENAFTGQERDAIDQLRDIVGHAINAVERKQALLNNIVVRLEFVLEGVADPLVEAATDLDTTLSLERTVPAAGEETVLFAHLPGGDVETAREYLADVQTVTEVRVVGRQDADTVLELRVADLPVTASLASYGGQVLEAVAEDGELRVAVELPGHVDVREVVSAVRRQYPGAELASQRSTTRSAQTLTEFQSALADRLTEKQRAALEAAYAAGYFEWPRGSTGEEVAEMLDISPATFHEHLRIGLRELLGASLERDTEEG